MRLLWGLGVSGLVLAAVCIPVGAALAPGTADTSTAGTPQPDPFQPELQLAERTLADPQVDELSGLAASRLHPGVLYGINDSGGGPVVYAIDSTGATVARITLPNLNARDWEALAPGWDADGTPVLWIGDIGDNKENQEHVRLVKIAEPKDLVDQEVTYQAYWIAYPDGPHNAEALLVDPRDGSITVATKGDGEYGALYRVAGRLRSSGDNVLERVMAVPATITDGAWELSPTGEPRMVLIDYWRLHRWTPDGWVSELGPLQLQREALAWPWLPGGSPNDRVLLGSEGAGSSIVTADAP